MFSFALSTQFPRAKGDVVEVLGEYEIFLMGLRSGLDSNCVRVERREEGYFVIPFGRNAGEEYEDIACGPFENFHEAHEEAEELVAEDELSY